MVAKDLESELLEADNILPKEGSVFSFMLKFAIYEERMREINLKYHKMNQIILSANEDKTYLDFWKPVSYAYRKMFPGIMIHLALLTDRDENDPFVSDLREHGKVTLFKKLPNITEFAQAKMIRFILASEQGNDVCYIDDIDLFPLSKSFITNKVDKRPAGSLLCVGGEVYGNNGCYPISQITGEGWLFKKFINPFDLEYKDLFESWRGNVMFDRRESIDIVLDWSKDDYFSDERLIHFGHRFNLCLFAVRIFFASVPRIHTIDYAVCGGQSHCTAPHVRAYF